VQPLTDEERIDPIVKDKIATMDKNIKIKFWAQDGPSTPPEEIIPLLFDNDDNIGDDGIDNANITNEGDATGLDPIKYPQPLSGEDIENHDMLDKYISARVRLPQGDSYMAGTVKHRKRDSSGVPIGCSNDSPLLDMRLYQVEFNGIFLFSKLHFSF
jgi:hypothetical protein